MQFSKLLGFDVVAAELSAGLNFQDEIIGDRLGAKIGPEPTGGVDFKEDILSAKLGAKVGQVED